jgi:hypothetical protein
LKNGGQAVQLGRQVLLGEVEIEVGRDVQNDDKPQERAVATAPLNCFRQFFPSFQLLSRRFRT